MCARQAERDGPADRLLRKAVSEVNLAQIEQRSGKPQEEIDAIFEDVRQADPEGFESQRRQASAVKLLRDRSPFLASLATYERPRKRIGDPVVLLEVGVPGAGKSRIAEEYIKVHPEARTINVGDAVLEAAKARGVVPSSAENLHGVHAQDKKRMENVAAEKVAARLKGDGVYLVDSHATVGTGEGLIVAATRHLFNMVRPDAIVLITSPAENILRFRLDDKTKERGTSIGGIKSHLKAESAVAELASESGGVPLLIVESSDRDFKRMVAEIDGLIGNIRAERAGSSKQP
jgi:adenylate kinase